MTQSMIKIKKEKLIVDIDYTNWRDERRFRPIRPIKLYFGTTQWHPTDQWVLYARDLEDDTEKYFAMSKIHEWRPRT